jgi:group I intron endonuclease
LYLCSIKIEGKYNYSGIYCLKNTLDERCYVGSAQKLNYRLWNHKHKLIKGTHANNILQNFVNKHGIDSIYFEILEPVEINNLIIREQYFIDVLKPEFNILPKAGSSAGTIMSEEQKIKISKNRTGILHTEDTKRRISETMTGVPKTKEHSAKVGLKHKGKTVSQEQKNKISKANKGNITTPKVTWEIVNEIRKLHLQGIKDKELAIQFNLSKVQINNIRNNKCWINNGL